MASLQLSSRSELMIGQLAVSPSPEHVTAAGKLLTEALIQQIKINTDKMQIGLKDYNELGPYCALLVTNNGFAWLVPRRCILSSVLYPTASWLQTP